MVYFRLPTHIEFDNQSPDTIEVRPVTSTDLTLLAIPPEASSFQFVAEMSDAPAKPVLPRYYLGREFGAPADMATKYPGYAANINYWLARLTVEAVGKVEWDHEAGGQRWEGLLLIPLVDGTALFDKKSRRVVWPTKWME